MTKSAEPSTPSGSPETQQRRRQITSYKNTTTSPATDTGPAFLSLLKDEGITLLFGNPGTTELPVMHALMDHPELTYVMAMQESLVLPPLKVVRAHITRLSEYIQFWDNPFMGSDFLPPIHGPGGICRSPSNPRNMSASSRCLSQCGRRPTFASRRWPKSSVSRSRLWPSMRAENGA